MMQRITITIDDDLLDAVDRLTERRGYASRSEALRDILRETFSRERAAAPRARCVATLTYVYDHDLRDLAQRLTHAHHDRHDLAVAAMHVHLDHSRCLEVSVLRGRVDAVQAFADALTTQRGVRHASLHMVPARVVAGRHRHGEETTEHEHVEA
jgi:CopG family nickel-responsive transcriptional regulator